MEHIWTMLMHKILQNHLLCAFVANLKIGAIYALYPESFCNKNLAIRKVFAFCDSVIKCSMFRDLLHVLVAAVCCMFLSCPFVVAEGDSSCKGCRPPCIYCCCCCCHVIVIVFKRHPQLRTTLWFLWWGCGERGIVEGKKKNVWNIWVFE